ncbi:hypothetical protein CLAFUW4_03155 [Fulvia fulva]|uniref:Translation initiation factor 3 N-terminal domain-containing protein n=1 Tax=Passalora fulva TaxID=5499 RepID=A0A9Q8LA53_PASFU|nr:uncharacterized protein CLAFUR5_03139 [Fulvia fulva]KAK4631623.1 hypothetical protein CLAFUR4_03144 [Fulvia fulva]KAK4633224.1 hypothetical protein CLAFUR0_03149 [Fulvia fulva]UJO13746.1 hypothetical protein CLAFUR5_03139 [Fulvia fulva]WPV10646.1 hypothetical protein CLAFUW4_03155 [Fulvia fulva]WPV26885.1 hypothetical protein CLAFUW7_03148 [Fulvia fulva]
MSCQRCPSITQALYRAFVLPAVHTSATKRPLLPHILSKPQSWPSKTRSFSQTPFHYAKTRAPEERSHKWNNEITHRHIYLVDQTTGRLEGVDPETGEGEPTLYKTWDIMNDMDDKTHRLVQMSPDEPDNYDFIPVCKIVSKKEDYDRQKKRKKQEKQKQKVQAITSHEAMKTVELNWAIDKNDLGHRLGKIKGFLDEGRRVEVVLASKKQGRKASKEECEEVLKMVQGVVAKVDGAKEKEALQGKLGGFATLVLQGRPIKAGAGGSGGAAKKSEEDDTQEQ